MRVWGAVIAACVSAGGAAEAVAGEAVPILDGDRFHAPGIAAAPSERERAQAVNGSLYAVVAPVHLGESGFFSFLRLFNGGASTATFTVTVVGSGTATAYGTATLQVPSRASIQYPMFEILVPANAMTRNEADTQISFYIQSTEPLAGYQHVTLNHRESFFQNASVCRWTIQEAVGAVAPSAMLTHIHTSPLAAQGYPSFIELHNFAATPVTYRLTVIDAASGNVVGETNFPARANASYTIPWSQIEASINWGPLSTQVHANLVVTDPSGAAPAVLLGQTVRNQVLGATANVSTMCAVNAPPSLGGDGGAN